MKLEDAIQQKNFENEYIKLVLNIMYTGNWLHLLQTRRLKKYGLSHQQFNVLRILRGQHPKAASVGLVLSRMLEPSSNITRLVDKLEQKGLVSRYENKENRRMQDLKITKEGLDLLKKIGHEMENFKPELADISEKEAELANDVLDRLRVDLAKKG
ncbi:MAG TPA: MarR family transcriptional regulator [Bacteroidia bacterium]|nr:MarR family transcriptional regulator [Bacteroidia bacterium]